MDISGVDLNLLLALDALLVEQNVTRAGRRIGLSQSAMSAALGRLRNLFSDPLFVRTRRGMKPTERALALMDPLRAALANIRLVLDSRSFDPAETKMTFHVATGDYAELVVLPDLFAALEARAPRATLHVQPLAGRPQEQLDDGGVDVVVAPFLRGGTHVQVVRLFDDGFVGAARAGHPARQSRITLRRFAAQRHLLVSPEGEGPVLVDHALAKFGLSRTVALRVPHFLAAPTLLATSDLVATLPERLVRHPVAASKLASFELPFDAGQFTMMAGWHVRTNADPAQRWFRQLIVEVCQKY